MKHGTGFEGIPDIHPKADNLGIFAQNALSYFGDGIFNNEFQNDRMVLKFLQIGIEISEADGRMRIAGVEGRQDDVFGHAASLKAMFQFSSGLADLSSRRILSGYGRSRCARSRRL